MDADSEAGSAASSHPPAGWVRLGRYRWYASLATSSALIIVLVLLQILQFGYGLFRFFDAVTAVAITVGSCAAVIVGMALITKQRGGQSWADFDHDLLRVGRRTVAFGEVDWATLLAVPSSADRALIFSFGSASVRSVVVLRDRRGRVLDEDVRGQIAEVLRRSAVHFPSSPYDPSGRFARFNFPNHLDREDAVELVLNPPGPADALPISS
jgi:hypothetical protein